MTGEFTPAERTAVDVQIMTFARALHRVAPANAERLHSLLLEAESTIPDRTLARVLVAAEIMRGITHDSPSPVTVRTASVPEPMVRTLRGAESLGRALAPCVFKPRSRVSRLFGRQRPLLSHDALQALMRCRVVASAQERRAMAGHGLRTA